MMEVLNNIWNSLVLNVVPIATNATSLAVVAWVANKVAESRADNLKSEQNRILERVKGEQSRELEGLKSQLSDISSKLKSNIERNSTIFKAHFDIEFPAYKQLWDDCDSTYDKAAQIYTLTKRDHYKKDFDEIDNRALHLYDNCVASLERIRRLRPFIVKEICDEASELARRCVNIIQEYRHNINDMIGGSSSFSQDDYSKELGREISEIKKLSDSIADRISVRIKAMYVDV